MANKITTPEREARRLYLWRCAGGGAMLGCLIFGQWLLIPIVWGVLLEIERRHDANLP